MPADGSKALWQSDFLKVPTVAEGVVGKGRHPFRERNGFIVPVIEIEGGNGAIFSHISGLSLLNDDFFCFLL